MPFHDVAANWIKNGFGHQVDSADDVMRAIGRIGTLQVGRRYVWRGVANWKWRLRSSLLRTLIAENGSEALITEAEVRARERVLIREARTWGIGKELGGAATDQQLLASLQHHGAPTRLLDVTSNPMTALWFACERTSADRNTSGALMAFDVTQLNVLTTASHELPPSWGSTANPLSWHFDDALSDSESRGVPFLVHPSYPDQRMIAQEGLFLTGAVPSAPSAHAIDGLPLSQSDAPGAEALATLFAPKPRTVGRPRKLPFVVLIIPPTLKNSLIPHLENTYNRGYRQLFPDIAGFVRAVHNHKVDLRAR